MNEPFGLELELAQFAVEHLFVALDELLEFLLIDRLQEVDIGVEDGGHPGDVPAAVTLDHGEAGGLQIGVEVEIVAGEIECLGGVDPEILLAEGVDALVEGLAAGEEVALVAAEGPGALLQPLRRQRLRRLGQVRRRRLARERGEKYFFSIALATS